MWDKEIKELEEYFNSVMVPVGTFQVTPSLKITDLSVFIDSHLQTVKNYNGNKTFIPYMDRLISVKNFLISYYDNLKNR